MAFEHLLAPGHGSIPERRSETTEYGKDDHRRHRDVPIVFFTLPSSSYSPKSLDETGPYGLLAPVSVGVDRSCADIRSSDAIGPKYPVAAIARAARVAPMAVWNKVKK